MHLNKKEKDILWVKIGQLLWTSNQTRPDISFDVSILTSNLNTSTVNELIYCNTIISKIHHNCYSLHYKKINEKQIVVYIGASCGNLKNSGSQGTYLFNGRK